MTLLTIQHSLKRLQVPAFGGCLFLRAEDATAAGVEVAGMATIRRPLCAANLILRENGRSLRGQMFRSEGPPRSREAFAW